MRLIIKCNVCSTVLVTVDKPVIYPEDETGYQEGCACNDHGQDDIIAEVQEE